MEKLERFITDEKTGINYELIGDYYFPCLKYGHTEDNRTYGKYGMMRKEFLKHHRKGLYYRLLTSGELHSHLCDIELEAHSMEERLINDMKKQQGLTETMKANEMMKWVGMMNNIRKCAEEIVLNDIVYV